MEFGISPSSGLNDKNIYSFYGLNRTRRGTKGECEEMENMSSKEYPCASPRGGRRLISQADSSIKVLASPDSTTVSSVTGITGIADGGFYYNGVLKSGKFILRPEWKWSIARMGNLYIINGYNPDKIKSEMYYYNIDTDEFSEGGTVMSDLIVTSGPNYLRTIHRDPNDAISDYTVTLSDGTVIDNNDFFKKYAKTYELSNTENIFEKYFKVGDEVTIEGFPSKTTNEGQLWFYSSSSGTVKPTGFRGAEYNNTLDTDNMATIKNVDKYSICTAYVKSFSIKSMQSGHYAHEIYFDLYNKDGEEAEFDDLIDYTYPNYCSGVKISKRKRALTNIAIHQGRIWGTAPSGNRIYASASDDIFSFTADDFVKKYGVRLNSDTAGTFNGLCPYNNDLIAFKDDSITIISGTNPNNYYMSTISGVGCIAPKSIVPTPDGIIFLDYRGFYIYDGSLPRHISNKLNSCYRDAVSGFDGNSYYTSALSDNEVRELLVYDMQRGVWHKEDDFDATGFFRFNDGFYMSDDSSLYKADGECDTDWSFTLMRTFDNNMDLKSINEIWIRADVDEGAKFYVETSSDDDEFVHHRDFEKPGLNIYRCSVRPVMGSSYRIRLGGYGKVVIYEIELKKSVGGRRYKPHGSV